MLNWLSQILSVTKFGVLSIPQRLGSVAAATFAGHLVFAAPEMREESLFGQ